jgi:hypothetical protein
MPSALSEDLVSPAELPVLFADQEAAGTEVANGSRVLPIDPLALRDGEQRRERLALDRPSLARQRRSGERRIPFAVDEEERRSANARQRLARPRVGRRLLFVAVVDAHEL